MFLSKLAGIFCILFGFFMAFYFPGKTGGVIPGGSKGYQPEQMGKTGIIIGFILMGIGAYILLYY